MELEYKDPSKKGRVGSCSSESCSRWSRARRRSSCSTTRSRRRRPPGVQTISGYVAAAPIPARKPIAEADIVLRADIPLDGTNAQVITDKGQLLGRLLAVDVAPGQLLTPNLLASGTAGLGFAILKPDEIGRPRLRGLARRVRHGRRRPRRGRRARTRASPSTCS